MVWWRRRRERSGRYVPAPRSRTPGRDFEKPEVKTMTQGVTYRAGGLGFDCTAGLAGAAGVLDAAAAGDVADRGLRAAGRHCARCGRPFTEDTPVRRTTAGGWVHDVC
ncbi:MAG TPA: hypothetical protein VFJ98_04710 [Mycobacteriales bacterium]|jgi:hypothetical protein|nr:hypothetical protein [Mycobacteriales bacterium]